MHQKTQWYSYIYVQIKRKRQMQGNRVHAKGIGMMQRKGNLRRVIQSDGKTLLDRESSNYGLHGPLVIRNLLVAEVVVVGIHGRLIVRGFVCHKIGLRASCIMRHDRDIKMHETSPFFLLLARFCGIQDNRKGVREWLVGQGELWAFLVVW